MAAPAEAVAPPPALPPPASLYVGDLHPDLSNEDLFNAFFVVGSLASVRVCKDSMSGRSLGYGYVNYLSTEDATNAIEKFNNTSLKGKTIRVMWSRRDPDARKSGIGNLFVKNLHESIDNMKLHDLFSKFGNILSCKVVLSSDEKSKGYGFVQYDSEKSANDAIENLNGTMVGGKEIYVGNFIKKSDRVLLSPDAKYTNLYMKNFDSDVTEELLVEKFSEFGKIANLVISRDDNGVSRGFGFVNFENPNDAKMAMEAMNGAQMGSKTLYVARAQKKAERDQILRRQFEEKRNEQMQKYKGSNLYIKNIDDHVSDDELREHFSQFGTIISAKLMLDEKGISRGFGFVCFSTPEEANKAVSSLHGNMFHGKPLYVAIAQRKEDRRAQLQVHYAQRMTALAGSSTAVVPTGYPPLFYGAPPGLSQLPPRQGLMYQPLGIPPAWRGSGFSPPTRPSFQPMPFSMLPNMPRQQRQNRGRTNGHLLPQGGQSTPLMPRMQTPQTLHSSKYTTGNQQGGRQSKYIRNQRIRDINGGPSIIASHSPGGGAAAQGRGSETLSSMLAAASPEDQKRILGEHLFPLVQKQQSEHASKITGMLLEMDNSELLLLLESPESLTTKVEEAVIVLERSKTKVGVSGGGANQENTLHNSANFLSEEVAVN